MSRKSPRDLDLIEKPKGTTLTTAVPMVLGSDPGFASVGYSIVALRATDEVVIDMGVIRTKKSGKKRHVLACEDNFVRAREIAKELSRLVYENKVQAICAEAMSFPRQSSVAAKMAMCWGVLALLTESTGIPLVQPTPQAVKKALCGKVSASKEDVEAAVRARYGAAMNQIDDLPKTMWEHVFDSFAVIVASLDGEVLRMARRFAAA